MTNSNRKKKNVSGGTIERRHINILRACIYVAIALIIAVLLLQVLILLLPGQTEESVFGFGQVTRRFRLTPRTAVVFLMIPAILLVLVHLYLSRYFKRNTHGSHMTIAYLEKHPRNKREKYYYMAFVVAAGLASLVLCAIDFIRVGKTGSVSFISRAASFLPFIVMIFAALALYLLFSLMRQRKRHYSHHSHGHSHSSGSGEPAEPEEVPAPAAAPEDDGSAGNA